MHPLHENNSKRNYFIKGNDTIFKGRFESCYGTIYDNNKFKYPQNIGIARIKQSSETYCIYNSSQNSNLPICDLVDIKGNRLLNDNSIIHIMHFYSDWFILLKGPYFFHIYQADFYNFSQVEIYNLKTKEKIPVNSYKNQNQIVHILSGILVPNQWYDYYRPSKSFKVSMCIEVGFKENKIYYINENDQIETEIKKY